MGKISDTSLWLIWFALLLVAVGQIIHTEMFYSAVGFDLLDKYEALDSQLNDTARLSKKIFAICEASCFVIISFVGRLNAGKNKMLIAAYILFFFLTMFNLSDAITSNLYWTYKFKKVDFTITSCCVTILLIEYQV